jgi:transposase
MQPATENGYRFLSIESCYGDVAQRWLIVYSQAAYHREVATLEKKIAKERETAEKSLHQLSHKEFDTQVAAREAVSTLSAGWRYHEPQIELVAIPHYQNRGRPNKEQLPTRIGFQVVGQVVEQPQAIEQAKNSKGKFVLATNELDAISLDDATILSAYKGQNVSVERGFRFLKDPLFFASSLFLEKPQRIMALLMVMGLSLLVYALAERSIRSELTRQGRTIPNQVGKPTKRPTLRRIFQVFEGIDLLLIHQASQTQQVVVNLKPIHHQILDLLGPEVKKCYIPDG